MKSVKVRSYNSLMKILLTYATLLMFGCYTKTTSKKIQLNPNESRMKDKIESVKMALHGRDVTLEGRSLNTGYEKDVDSSIVDIEMDQFGNPYTRTKSQAMTKVQDVSIIEDGLGIVDLDEDDFKLDQEAQDLLTSLQVNKETDESLVTGERISYLKNLGIVFNDQFQMKETDQICLLIRSHMELLPVLDPVDSSLLKIFKSNNGKMPKSFRTIALNLMKEVDLLMNKFQPLEDSNNIIKLLWKMKSNYFQNYLKDISLTQNKDDGKFTELKNQLKTLNEDYDNHVKIMKKNRDDDKNLTNDIVKMVKKIKETWPVYVQSVERKTVLKHELENIKMANSLEDFYLLDSDILEELGLANELTKFKTSWLLMNNCKEHLEFLSVLKRQAKLKRDNGKLDQLKKLIQKTKECVNEESTTMSNAKSNMITGYKENIQVLTKSIDKNKKSSSYSKEYLKLLNIRKEGKKMIDEEINFQVKIDEMQDYIRREGYSKNVELDFLITNIDIEILNLEYKKLRKLAKANELDSSPELSLQKKNIENEVSKMDVNNIQGLNQLDITLIDTEEMEGFNEGYFSQKQSKYNALMKGLMDVYSTSTEGIEESYQIAKEQLEKAKNIRTFEEKIDRKLGKIFGHIFRVSSGKKCFSDTVLSYYIFTMIKANIIIDEVEFLDSFLSTISQRSLEDAQRFIVLNYALFSGKQYLEEISDKFANAKDLGQLNREVRNFSGNYSIMVTAYKEETNYNQNLMTQKNSLTGKLFSTAKHLFMRKLYQWMKDHSIENIEEHLDEVFEMLLEMLFQAIPVLGNIPLLAKILSKIVMTLLMAVVDLMFALFETNSQMLIQRLKHAFSAKFRSKGEQLIKSLDFESLITEHLELNEDIEITSFKMNHDSKGLENVFFLAINNPQSLFNQVEVVEVWKVSDEISDQLKAIYNIQNGESREVKNESVQAWSKDSVVNRNRRMLKDDLVDREKERSLKDVLVLL